MSQAENQSAFKVDTFTSPGKLLQAARQAQQLTYTEVANKLRLSEQYVKDLEDDEYQHIGARIYVRGYLLNYAKLLGVPTEDIQSAIESSMLPDENVAMQRMIERNAAPINIRLNPYGHNKRHLSKWFLSLFIVLLVALVVVWWQNQKTHLYSSVQTENPLAPSSNSSRAKNEQSISLSPSARQGGQANTTHPASGSSSAAVPGQSNAAVISGDINGAMNPNTENSNVIVSQQPVTDTSDNNAQSPNTPANSTLVSPVAPAYQQSNVNQPVLSTPSSDDNNATNTTSQTTEPTANPVKKTTATQKSGKKKRYRRYRSNASRYSSSSAASNRSQLPAPGGY